MILASEIEVARKRLYANDAHFNNFNEMDAEKVNKIKELVKKFRKDVLPTLPKHGYVAEELEKYIMVMRYLGSTNTNDSLPTYDEKIAFLIECLDPRLEMYKCYLSLPVIIKAQIATEEDTSKKLLLNQMYNNQASTIGSKIRLKMGFYDPKMLSYEIKYFKKVRCHDDLLTDVKQAFFSKMSSLFKEVKDFDGITKEENDEVILKAEEYADKYGKPSEDALAFQILHQADILKLDNIKEMIIFFILVMDKDLKLLDIYNNYSTWEDIKGQALSKLGFYNKDLIILERKYQEKFVPDFDPWELKKEINH